MPSSIKSVLGLFTPYGQGIYLAISLSSFSTYTSKPHTQGYFQTFSPLSISLLAFMHAHTHTHIFQERQKHPHPLTLQIHPGKKKGLRRKERALGNYLHVQTLCICSLVLNSFSQFSTPRVFPLPLFFCIDRPKN